MFKNQTTDVVNGKYIKPDVSRVCAFMDLANYYRKYVKEFSAIAKTLNHLLKSDQERQ